MRSIAFDDIDEVRNQISATLILVLYLAPLGIDLLLDSYESVVLADPPE